MILIIADLHGDINRTKTLLAKAKNRYGFMSHPDDIIVVLGDMLNYSGKKKPSKKHIERSENFLDYLENLPCKIASVQGNRDSDVMLSALDANRCEFFGGDVRQLRENVFMLDDGYHIFNIGKGQFIRTFALGGALSHSRLKKNSDLSMMIDRYEDVVPVPSKFLVDLVLSHDAPSSKMGIISIVFGKNYINEQLEQIKSRLFYRKWLFGHHHVDVRTSDDARCIYNDIIIIKDRSDIVDI